MEIVVNENCGERKIEIVEHDNDNVGVSEVEERRQNASLIGVADNANISESNRNRMQPWTKDEILAVDRDSWSWPPNFQRTTAGQSFTLAILTAAKTQGYGNTLDYPYRTEWFEKMFITWYQPAGLLGRYKIVQAKAKLF